MDNLSFFALFCGVILLIGISQRILRQLGKEKWANFLHYGVYLLGVVLLSKLFYQLVYLAEEMLKR